MRQQDILRQSDEVRESYNPCPVCDECRVTTTVRQETITYGSGNSATTLHLDLPVRVCEGCGFEYLDHEAELLKHEAICRHLGVLTSAEVLAVRNRYGLTRSSFSEITGLGEATLNRWENGVVIQNLANDRYLRLLSLPQAMSMLNRLVDRLSLSCEPNASTDGRFRVLRITDLERRRKSNFRLRKAS